MTDYLDTVGQQVVDKFNSVIGDYDLALVSAEKAPIKVRKRKKEKKLSKKTVRKFFENFDQIHCINCQLPCEYGDFQESKLKKLLNRTKSIVLLLSPEIKY